MKLATKIMAGTAALAFLTVAVTSAQAQLIQVLTITATATIQGNSSDNGTITTAAAPTKFSVTTKAILTALAVDENAEGNYPNTTFPAGAKLVTINNNSNTNDFQVVSASGNLLVDVSDIISFNNPGNNNIFSGKQNDTNNLASPTTINASLLTFSFDDTAISGGEGIQFYFTGIGTGTTTDTIPNANGVYLESDKGALVSATGEGMAQGRQLLISGAASATGKGTLNINP